MPKMDSGLRLVAFLYLADVARAGPLGFRDEIRRDATPTCKECWTIGAREISKRLSSSLKADSTRMLHLLSDTEFDQQYGQSVRLHK